MEERRGKEGIREGERRGRGGKREEGRGGEGLGKKGRGGEGKGRKGRVEGERRRWKGRESLGTEGLYELNNVKA